MLIDWFQLITVSGAHFKTGLTERVVHRSVCVYTRADAIDPLQRAFVISSPNLSSFLQRYDKAGDGVQVMRLLRETIRV